MSKIRLEPGPFILPMPTALVGAEVDGKPNWAEVAPLLFTFPDKGYWKLGEYVAEAWSVAKDYRLRGTRPVDGACPFSQPDYTSRIRLG